jgi:hypothetical protein
MITPRTLTLRHLLLIALLLCLTAGASVALTLYVAPERGAPVAPCTTFDINKLHDPAFVRSLNQHYNRKHQLDMILVGESGESVMCFQR